MKVKLAHLRDQGIDFAVFAADSKTRNRTAREELLHDLVCVARASGLKVDKAALCYREGQRLKYFGTPDLVRYLSGCGVQRWTHSVQL